MDVCREKFKGRGAHRKRERSGGPMRCAKKAGISPWQQKKRRVGGWGKRLGATGGPVT